MSVVMHEGKGHTGISWLVDWIAIELWYALTRSETALQIDIWIPITRHWPSPSLGYRGLVIWAQLDLGDDYSDVGGETRRRTWVKWPNSVCSPLFFCFLSRKKNKRKGEVRQTLKSQHDMLVWDCETSGETLSKTYQEIYNQSDYYHHPDPWYGGLWHDHCIITVSRSEGSLDRFA